MSELAARKTPITPDDLKSALSMAWKLKFGECPPTNAIELLMSQSALETAAWVSCVAFNLSNVKSNGTDGDWCFFTTTERLLEKDAHAAVAASTAAAPAHLITTEPDAEGKLKVLFEPRSPVCRFRAFSSLAQGAIWLLDFLEKHYAAAWSFVLDGDLFGFNHALKEHGFYTALESAYLSGLARFFDEYGTPKLDDMSAITDALASLGYASTSAFQQAMGLTVDNTPGPLTRAKLRWALAHQDPTPEAA